jgi:hypothetical protein
MDRVGSGDPAGVEAGGEARSGAGEGRVAVLAALVACDLKGREAPSGRPRPRATMTALRLCSSSSRGP